MTMDDPGQDAQPQESLFPHQMGEALYARYFHHCPYCVFRGLTSADTVAHMRLIHQADPPVDAWKLVITVQHGASDDITRH